MSYINEALKKAVSLDKSAIDWARKDADLKRLRGLSEFKNITGNTEYRKQGEYVQNDRE
jgi:hypothetical protein